MDPVEIVTRYAAGETLRDLAHASGLSRDRVRAAIVAERVRLRPRGRVTGKPVGGLPPWEWRVL
jgi:uncharacterized protein (DUF433 family)